MIRFHFFLILVFTFCITDPTSGTAQNSYRKQLYESFIAGHMEDWGQTIASFEANTLMDSEENKLELISYCYGYVGYLLSVKRLSDAGFYIDKGQGLAEQVIKSNPANAAAYAFKGAFLGYRISTDHSIAFILGSISIYNIQKAYSMDPNNLQAMIDKGNFFFYAPGIFGGNVDKAIPLYEKAAISMETTGLSKENWRYFNLLVVLAKANAKAENYEEAKQVYNKMLKIEPEFGWVKNELLPDLLKRTKHL